jgi:hypothetical protein
MHSSPAMLMATFTDVAGVQYPKNYQDHDIVSLEGKSEQMSTR